MWWCWCCGCLLVIVVLRNSVVWSTSLSPCVHMYVYTYIRMFWGATYRARIYIFFVVYVYSTAQHIIRADMWAWLHCCCCRCCHTLAMFCLLATLQIFGAQLLSRHRTSINNTKKNATCRIGCHIAEMHVQQTHHIWTTCTLCSKCFKTGVRCCCCCCETIGNSNPAAWMVSRDREYARKRTAIKTRLF